MSRVIDDGIVRLKFDSDRFNNAIRTSLQSISNLKNALKSGFDNIGRHFSLASINNSIQQVSEKFSAFGVMGMTVLQNLTNSAVEAGKKIVSALTIDPLKMGYQEYETQINAIQTILSNTREKGTTMDDVTKALDELNHYADMTIYNFTEMTRNIGTFTAAGIDLDTSVSAIKGIANLAAVSGSNSEQASRAMYQLSQALSSGSLKLQDWNSVVNAGMGGQVFQDALKETARVHGIAIDDMIKQEGSFRETLKSGWISKEILTETLAKFTGDLTEAELKSIGYTDEQIKKIIALGQDANDAATKVKTFTQLMDTLNEAMQSGWTKTWELLIGNFEEAREFLTEISDVLSKLIDESSTSRNTMLETWQKLGGRDGLLAGVKNLMYSMINISKTVKARLEQLIPPMTAEKLFSLTERFKKFTETLLNSTDKIRKTAESVKSLGDVKTKGLDKLNELGKNSETFGKIKDTFTSITDKVSILGEFQKLTSSIFDILKKGSANIVSFVKRMNELGALESLIVGIRNAVAASIKAVRMLAEAFSEVFSSGMNPDFIFSLIEKFRKLTESFVTSDKASGRLKNIFVQIFTTAKNVLKVIAPLFKALFNAAVSILPVFVSAITSVISAVVGFLPQIVSLAASVIPALISAFIRAIPMIAAFAQQGFRLAGKILPTLLKGFWSALNAVTGFWNGFQKLGGMNALGNLIFNTFCLVVKAVQITKSAFETIFPSIQTGAQLIFKIIDSLRQFTATLLNSSSASNILETILSGIFGAFEVGGETISAISGGIINLANIALPILKGMFESTFNSITSENIAAITERVEDLLDILKASSGFRTAVFADLIVMFSNGVKSIAAFVSNFSELGGFVSITQILRNVFDGVVKIIGLAGQSFKEVFGKALDVNVLFDIVDGVRKLTESFLNSQNAAASIKNIFTGLFSVIKLLGSVIGTIVNIVSGLNPSFNNLGETLLFLVGKIGEAITKFVEFTEATGIFDKVASVVIFAINGITSIISGLVTTIKPIIENVKNVIFGVFDAIVARIQARESQISDFTNALNNTLGGFANVFKIFGSLFKKLGEVVFGLFSGLMPVLTKLGEFAGIAFNEITSAIYDSIENVSLNGIIDLFNGGVFGGLLIGINKFVSSLTNITSQGGGILSGLKNVLNTAQGCLTELQNNVKTDTIKKIATSIAILAGSLLVLSLIDSVKLAASLGALTVMLGELMGSMALMSKIGELQGFSSLTKMSGLLIGISAAVLILSAAISQMATLSWEGMLKGLSGMAAMLYGLNLFLNNTNLYTSGIKMGIGLFLLAQALSVMSNSIIKMGSIDPVSLITGLLAMAALLAEIGVFVTLTGDAKKVLTTSIAMIALGAALNIMAAALKSFGSLSLSEIGLGLLAMGGSLALIIGALYLVPKNVLAIGVGLVVVASAVKTLAKSLTIFAGMSIQEIGLSLLALAGSLAAIVLAMNLANGGVAGAVGITIMALAIGMLVPALLMLGTMSLAELGMSLLAIAGAFALMAAAGALLTPLIPSILGMAAALLMLGAGIALAGVGVSLLVTGLGALVVAVVGSADAILEACKTLIDILIAVISESAPRLLEVVYGVVLLIIDTLNNLLPKFFELLNTLLNGLLALFAEFAPKLIDLLGVLLVSLFEMLKDALPKMADAGLQMLTGLLRAIADNIEGVIAVAVDIVLNFINGIASKLGDIVQCGIDLIINFINGMADGIRNNTGPLLDACDNLIMAVIDGLAEGLFHGLNTVVDAAKEIGDAAVNGIKDLLGIHSPSKVFAEIGGFAVEGLTTAMTDPSMTNMVAQAVGGLAETATSSMTDGLSGFGNTIGEGFGNLDLSETGLNIGETLSNGIGSGIDMQGIADSMTKIGDTAANGITASPTITPVVDMSDTKKEVDDVNKSISDVAKNTPDDTTITTKKSVSETAKVSASMSNEVTSMIKTIKHRVGEINSNLIKLDKDISSLKVVMDTGTLVGELTSSLDTNLGNINAMQRRGV